MIISLVNHSMIAKEEVQRVLRSINRQLSEDFKPYWHKEVELRLEGVIDDDPNPSNPPNLRGDAVVYLWDDENLENALGFHDINANGVPYGFVFTKLSEKLQEPWSVTLSHEVLELAMDPEVNLLAAGPHPDPMEGGRIVYHWYELCDAVQFSTYQIDNVHVSNFVLPHYFTPANEHKNHNDFLGIGVNSFEAFKGGYVGFFDPETGQHENWVDETDFEAKNRKEIKDQFKGALRPDRHSESQIFSPLNDINQIHCDAIIFELERKKLCPDDAKLVASDLIQSSLGSDWELQWVSEDPFEFDAVCKRSKPLSFSEAWELCHELSRDKAIVFAEPSLTSPVVGESDLVVDRAHSIRASGIGHRDLPGTEDATWALKACKVPQAWAVLDEGGAGEGVRIGHPDSGYRPHPELDADRVLTELDYDFLDKDDDPINEKGNHGLATASVIMSGGKSNNDTIKGPAWAAEIVPLRVTKPGLIRPTPVLLLGGMRRLRNAIDYARKIDCAVISMSLGGLPSRSVRKAINRAIDRGVIVLSAAGNEVKFVVWPARYKEVIAVAGSNIEGKPWSGSSRGEQVDITAPAESVWRARYDKSGNIVGRGEGTSYGVALVAGIAAVWLSYHGREKVVSKYGRNLQQVFRSLLKQTANKDNSLPKDKFGAGIVDAFALLQADLPADVKSGDSGDNARRAIFPRMKDNEKLQSLQAELEMAEALGALEISDQNDNVSIKNKRAGLSKTLRKVISSESTN